MKHTILYRRRFGALGLGLLLALTLTGCTQSWSRTETAMTEAVNHNAPERAAEIGRAYLEKEPDQPEAYQKLAEIYSRELHDPDSARAVLEQGIDETGDGSLFTALQELAGGLSALYPELTAQVYAPADFAIGGTLFGAMTSEQLRAAFPVSSSHYESDDNQPEDWYCAEDYSDYDVSMSYYESSYSRLSCNIALHAYTNRSTGGAPVLTPPAGAAQGDTMAAIMQKCGLPDSLIAQWQNCNYVNLDLTEDSADSYVTGTLQDNQYQFFEIEYDTSRYYGSLSFWFDESGKLTEYTVERILQ